MSVMASVLGLAMVSLAAVHLFFPSSRFNEVFSTLPLIAHGLAFPLPSGATLLLVAGAVVLLMFRRRKQAGDQNRLLWAVTALCITMSGILLAFSATSIALPSPLREDPSGSGPRLVMVSWNALDHFDRSSAQQIFETLGADVAVLPELQDRDALNTGSRIREALAGGGLDPQEYAIFESPPTGTHIAPLTVIVRKEFAQYESMAVEQATFGTVHLVPQDGSGLPKILAFHTAPPVPRWMTEWANDLEHVRDLANNAGGNVIIAGDLNGTLRHGSLGTITSHGDVLATIPAIDRGTWPSTAPRVLRSTIDHILIPLKTSSVIDAEVTYIPGSDHATLATTISTDG